MAAAKLLELIALAGDVEAGAEQAAEIMLEPEFVVRESTAPVRQAAAVPVVQKRGGVEVRQ